MNWGKGIALVIVAFMAFIVSFVYRAFQRDIDLVDDDYYQEETMFDENKESRSNYRSLSSEIVVEQKEGGVAFLFPEEVGAEAKGKIQFYRPDAKKYDREFELLLDNKNQQVLAYDNFKEGYYDIKVEWTELNQTYIFEDNISF